MKKLLLAAFFCLVAWPALAATCGVSTLQVKDNAAVTANMTVGDDGSGSGNCESNVQVKGHAGATLDGTAGTPSTGVLTVQGVSGGTNLNVNCASGCSSSGGTSLADQSAFTQGTTAITPIGCLDVTSYSGLTSGHAGVMQCDSSGRPIIVGAGTAGTAAGGVLTVQGVSSMTPFLVNPGTAANWGVGATGSSVPANAVYLGITSGGNLTGWNGAVTNAGTFAVQDSTTETNTGTIAGAVSSSVMQENVKQVNGVTVLTGTGATGTGAQRVTVSQDTNTIAGSAVGTAGTASSNVVSVQGIASGTNLNVAQATASSLNATVTGGGSAGSAASGVVTVQGIAAMTPLLVTPSAAADPCMSAAKTNFALASSSGNTQVVGGSSSKKVYICSLSIVAAATAVVNLIEGTGAACTTANEAAVIGSTTAANGMSIAANGGLTLGNGGGTVAVTATAANGICILQSGTTALAGNVTYVQQ